MASKKVLVDLDMSSTSKVVNLPQASASGDAVRYDEFVELDANCDSLVTLTGVSENAVNFGSFTGSTISANGTLKNILQELETQAESNQLSVKADSTAFLSIDSNEISISSLAITDVTVDSTSTTIAAWNTANTGHGKEAGDVLVLANAANSLNRSYIHNGGTDGDENDWTRLQTDITPSNIRGYLSSNSGISYDSATGVFTAVVDDDTLEIHSDSLRIKAAGVGLNEMDFGTSAGQVDLSDLPLNTYSWSRITSPSDAEDAIQKLDADIAGIIASGNVALNNGTATDGNNNGSVDVRTDAVGLEVDGSNNLRLKDLGVSTAKLAADAVDGTKIADESIDSEHFVDGSLDFEHMNSAMVCSDFSAAGADQVARADKIKEYIDARSYMRMEDQDVDLLAGQDMTVTHNLGNKYVTCQVYDSADKQMDVEVTVLTANTLKIKASVDASDSKVIIVG